MREIVIDTETTGLEPQEGHRLVEVGAVELVERVPTGRTLHLYVNPGRPVPPEAQKVHGLTDAFLADKPPFAAVAPELLAFIGHSPLVAHNALFDWKFLSFELAEAGHPPIPFERMVDTVEIARRVVPGVRHSLDALCQRFGIDLSRRVRHGALLDAELLARVYIELTGGRQMGMDLSPTARAPSPVARPVVPARTFTVPPDEAAAHAAFVARMRNPLWARLAATG
ncbi:MAG: DNA polymerase III subunit epsilon [Sphingomonadaceae bacterium]|uniref:DNA polymerase III subunit epsilon n=1 Tax=Thermaurantiacus sp. TaxID=2820283 RepID=UPI00298EEB42|nr:DNA polymerase III subunit epsilon [Thermaurantiacus sp.]MCS6987665.1 DNA polymerase III subunit epsilon [Sphingomonadaceae bacterium]MDW8415266.1 DNA polymerase III subunit epsilon [Thermaurantiacus sp.]